MNRMMVAAFAVFSVVAGNAMAEVPAAVGTTLTALQADAESMIALVWPFVLAVFGGMLLIKLFKRAGSKI